MTTSSPNDPRYGAFSFGEISDDFDNEFTKAVRDMCDAERAKIIPPENVAHYSHGGQWLELDPARCGPSRPGLFSTLTNTA